MSVMRKAIGIESDNLGTITISDKIGVKITPQHNKAEPSTGTRSGRTAVAHKLTPVHAELEFGVLNDNNGIVTHKNLVAMNQAFVTDNMRILYSDGSIVIFEGTVNEIPPLDTEASDYTIKMTGTIKS